MTGSGRLYGMSANIRIDPYGFVAEHCPVFSVRAMCRCLRIHPSGFYAWPKNPLSNRAWKDAHQTELIRKVWKDSGKVCGYRKLHDDLLDQGKRLLYQFSICPLAFSSSKNTEKTQFTRLYRWSIGGMGLMPFH